MCLPHKTYEPEANAVRVYEELYRLYRKVYFAFGQTGGPAVKLDDVPSAIRSRFAPALGG